MNGNEVEGGSQPGLSGEVPSQPISFMEHFGVLGRKYYHRAQDFFFPNKMLTFVSFHPFFRGKVIVI